MPRKKPVVKEKPPQKEKPNAQDTYEIKKADALLSNFPPKTTPDKKK